MEDVPFRKRIRLHNHNYVQDGYYYLTICTENRREILGHVVGGDALIAPSVLLSDYGRITEKYIRNIDEKYSDACVDKFIIMPNHIHMIVVLESGAMRVSPRSSISIPSIIRTLKTLVTKECGISLFQESYYDHIIRDENDYLEKWNYIDANPARWADDEYNPNAK
jgi:REP element-mobilizing transposase RayT